MFIKGNVIQIFENRLTCFDVETNKKKMGLPAMIYEVIDIKKNGNTVRYVLRPINIENDGRVFEIEWKKLQNCNKWKKI